LARPSQIDVAEDDQPYPRTIVRELLERERRSRTPRLRGLAQRLGVA